VDNADFGTTEREDWSNGTEGDDFDGIRETPSLAGSGRRPAATTTSSRRTAPRTGGTLAEHLRAPARRHASVARGPGRGAGADRLAQRADGYLADTPDEIALQLVPDEADLDDREALVERLNCALRWLQSLEPLGVGARNLSECLLLQLRAQPRSEVQAVAVIICEQHLDLLARRDFKKLAAATGADDELLRAAHGLIVSCEPKPGRPVQPRPRSHGRARRDRAEDRPRLEGGAQPGRDAAAAHQRPLCAGDQACQRGNGSSPHGRAAAGGALVHQEHPAALRHHPARVSKAIVERQKSFFTHGEIAMKPLVLREIADELGLHESTISRVTTAKYMATPLGTFELKYFFGSALNTEAGGNASSTAVRALIQQLVAAEPPTSRCRTPALADAGRAGHPGRAAHGGQVPRGAEDRPGQPEARRMTTASTPRSALVGLFLPCAQGVESLLIDECRRLLGRRPEASSAAESGSMGDHVTAMRSTWRAASRSACCGP
jgi:RNA polymerase sigma-54 factor